MGVPRALLAFQHAGGKALRYLPTLSEYVKVERTLLKLASIVFVHRLHGDRKATWSEGTVFWPRDFLSEDIPDARILSYGYDAENGHFWTRASQNGIKQHADNLSGDLADLQSKDSDVKPFNGQA